MSNYCSRTLCQYTDKTSFASNGDPKVLWLIFLYINYRIEMLLCWFINSQKTIKTQFIYCISLQTFHCVVIFRCYLLMFPWVKYKFSAPKTKLSCLTRQRYQQLTRAKKQAETKGEPTRNRLRGWVIGVTLQEENESQIPPRFKVLPPSPASPLPSLST